MAVSAPNSVERVEAPITARAYFLCVFASFGGIFFGYDTGWMGGVLGGSDLCSLRSTRLMPLSAMPYFIRVINGSYAPGDVVKSSDQSLLTSILSVGTFFGALLAGDIADYFGRRITIICGCVVFSIGCILQTASHGLGLVSLYSIQQAESR
jgi:SP family sugar:H+ symporter-like MFS transporter